MTGEMHAALASAGAEHPDFAAEPIRAEDVQRWTEEFQRHATTVLQEVGRRLDAIPGAFPHHILNDVAASSAKPRTSGSSSPSSRSAGAGAGQDSLPR
jgi:hypothetical protein